VILVSSLARCAVKLPADRTRLRAPPKRRSATRDEFMSADAAANTVIPRSRRPPPLHRYVVAWMEVIGGLVGFRSCRPYLGARAFNYFLPVGMILNRSLVDDYLVPVLQALRVRGWSADAKFRSHAAETSIARRAAIGLKPGAHRRRTGDRAIE
jgi:hypothetical protein